MAFVKWGLEKTLMGTSVTELSVDGVPIRRYLDMVDDQKRMIALVNKLLTCCDDERDAALIQEAHALLARIKGE